MINKELINIEQPVPSIRMSEWYSKQWDIHKLSDANKNDAFNQRQCGRITRFEAQNTTKWDNYLNNTRISDRITELTRWHNVINNYYNQVKTDIRDLHDEKLKTEHELDQIFIPLQIVNQCITIRESRRPTELTNDEASTELKNELKIIEGLKEALIEKIQNAHEKLNSLENLKNILEYDLKNKDIAIGIDHENYLLNENSQNIDYKSTALDTPKNTFSYESWKEHCREIKRLTEEELNDIYNFKEDLKMIRNRVRNEMKFQRDTTDFALRKRIYQTRKVKSELDWQKLKVQKEMDVLSREINQLEKAIINKENFLICAETRLHNRKSRPEFENCRDEVEEGLRQEIFHLQQSKDNLTSQYNCAKMSHKNLESTLIRLEKDLDDKGHSLMTDVMCLDTRCPLKHKDNEALNNETNQNISLMKLSDKISLES